MADNKDIFPVVGAAFELLGENGDWYYCSRQLGQQDFSFLERLIKLDPKKVSLSTFESRTVRGWTGSYAWYDHDHF